ncbi:VOC family protein [Tenacibaculum soleae]|uniref:VOC family protein n=1 Tax=Tenacibaculum soleae TaxID=447689 RepID=UPI002301306A|nr:VOC family protein [Tenacibaculum soleae]
MKKTIQIITLITLTISCSNFEASKNNADTINKLQLENDSLKKILVKNKRADKNQQIAAFLTFQENNAEEAMNFYVSLFDNSKIIEVERYGKQGPAKEGTIMVAKFELNGRLFMCSDSYIKHKWNFTPGVSNFVECKTIVELEDLFTKLSKDGKVMMPLGDYGFSKKFGFLEDKFGVSWQLNLQ